MVVDTKRNFIETPPPKTTKEVLMFSLDGTLVKEFLSVTDAANYIQEQTTNISACCSGKISFVKGYTFRYKKDFTIFKYRESNRGTLNLEHLEKCRILTSKKVTCNNIIYNSISEAERINNIPRGTLSWYIRNNKAYKTLLFKYYEDMIHAT